MAATQVSGDFPIQTSDFSEEQLKEYDNFKTISIRELLHNLISSDCWGLQINSSPIFNTYVLYNKIGRSFGKGHIQNDQYDFEQKVRIHIMTLS
jgi:hypothetical protein